MTDGSRIDALLSRVQAALDRVEPRALEGEVAAGAVVVDTRPVEQRRRDGEMPGALVVDRNVLEWRVDPTSPYRLGDDITAETRIVLVCNEGYSSSLAAATLRDLGLSRATDLVGGYQAWLAFMAEEAAAHGSADDVAVATADSLAVTEDPALEEQVA